MFFLDATNISKNKLSSNLHSCGTSIQKKHWNNIFEFIANNLDKDFSLEQAKAYLYAFGKSLNIFQVRKNIMKIFNSI